MGYALAVLAAMLWGLSYILNQRLLGKYSSWQMMFSSTLLGLVFLFPYVTYKTLPVLKSVTKIEVSFFVIVFVIGICGSWLSLTAVQKIGASKFSVIGLSQTVFTVIFSAMFFKEKLPLMFYVGATVMTVGASIVAYSCSGLVR